MAVIILVRHGQSENNVAGLLSSAPSDGYKLTELGKRQVKSAADSLSWLKVSGIYSSSITRALQTAEILSEGRNLKISKDDRLIERGMGTMDGKSSQDGRWPFLLGEEGIKANRVEPWEAIQKRTIAFADSLPEGNAAFLAASHEDTIKAFVTAVLHCSEWQMLGLSLKNGSITIVERSPKGYRLLGAGMPLLPDSVKAEISRILS